MPAPESAYRRQDAVLWPASGTDSYGEVAVGTPVELVVRWSFARMQARDALGNTVSYDAEVVLDREVAENSLLFPGTLDEWYATGSAGDDSKLYQVVTYSETPDLKGRFIRRTARLMRYRDSLPDGGG